MSQTKAGIIKFRQTMIAKHGSLEAWQESMRLLGKTGGATPTNKLKGFAARPELASEMGKIGGAIGGRISKRRKRSQVATATEHETRI